MVYVCLDKNYIDEKADEMLEAAKKEFGGARQQYLYIDDTDGRIIQFDGENGKLIIDCDFPWGFISFNVTIDSDTLIKILEYSIKKLNKFKTVLEATKGL